MSKPIGYAWLLEQYSLEAIPHHMACYTGGIIGAAGSNIVSRNLITLRNFPESYRPHEETAIGHLTFAFKREGVAAAYLRQLFQNQEVVEQIEAAVRAKPTGKWARIIWFWYEWLTGQTLALPECPAVRYEDALDSANYFCAPAINLRRYCLRNNIPGVPEMCPLVRKTEAMATQSTDMLKDSIVKIVSDFDPETYARAARYLIAAETRSTNEIESEGVSPSKMIRFNKALLAAGNAPITKAVMIDVHGIIKEERQREIDFRAEQNYVAGRGGDVSLPTPKPEYVSELMDTWFILYKRIAESELPVQVQAAVLSGVFIYVHPFMDGNGRISRYIIQEAMRRTGVADTGMVVPVSSGILIHLAEYYQVLDQTSHQIRKLTDYLLEDNGNLYIERANDHLFRDLDLTHYAEWLSKVIEEVVTELLPSEIDVLSLSDELYRRLDMALDLSTKDLRQMVKIIVSNGGRLSMSKRKRFYDWLKPADIAEIDQACEDVFPEGIDVPKFPFM